LAGIQPVRTPLACWSWWPGWEQWDNEIDLAYGERMGTYYRGFVNEEARALGFTLDDLRAWKPAVTTARRGRRRSAG
jgi:hypothetical protein